MTKEEKAYRDYITRLPCHFCQFPGVEHDDGVRRNDPAHIHSKGSGAKFIGNVLPCCRKHHTEMHLRGWGEMIERYGVEIAMAAVKYQRDYESVRNHTKEKRIQTSA
jgi:hypothetical protein